MQCTLRLITSFQIKKNKRQAVLLMLPLRDREHAHMERKEDTPIHTKEKEEREKE